MKGKEQRRFGKKPRQMGTLSHATISFSRSIKGMELMAEMKEKKPASGHFSAESLWVDGRRQTPLPCVLRSDISCRDRLGSGGRYQE